MAKEFQFMMVKHMLTNKGFTLIETLFVFMIICLLSLFTMPLHLPQKSEKIMIQEIVSFLNRAKLEAIVSKQTVTITFSKHNLSYYSLHHEDEYQLSKDTYFDEYQMTFNEYGHIKKAKTVVYHTPNTHYRFVYQIGSGCFYVES